jgi:hypothetical protein
MTTHTYGKLKLLTLTERTSGRGTVYLQGILNGLSVVAFRGEETQWGPTWDVFVSERQQKPPQSCGQQRPSQRDQQAVDLFQRPLDRG